MQVRVFNAVPVASPARPDVNPSSKAAEPYPLPSKHPSAFEISRSRHHNRKAVALVVVLFAVALVSIVVLAYFNLAILNRKTSFSSAGQARANLVALSALDYIKGDFISEIAAGSTQEVDPTGVGVPIYVPTTNSTMLPYRMTANISPADYTIPPNLVKWSSGTYPLWPATAAYGSAAGPTRGSNGNSTTNASINGHFLAPTFWTKPVFGTNATFSPSVVPQWVYLTRQGPISASAANLATLSNPTQSGYVIGRYAYTVYDEGGLLDIAAAGYSPDNFSSDPTDVGRKGSQGFADLTQLGLTTAQVDQLVGWRNAGSWNSTAAYLGYLTTNAPASGFLTAATNSADQAFVSRQDLIQYWFNEMGLTTAAGTNSLMYLTTFSREKNAPSWGPEHDANDITSTTYWNGSNTDVPYDNGGSTYGFATYNDPSGGISYAYHSQRDATVSNNRFFPNVRVKNAFTRLSGEQATVGQPLIKNRFDLSKLSWIQTGGTLPTGVGYKDIYNYFGLIPNYNSSGVFVSWTYNHTSATYPGNSNGTLATDTDHIMTLDQVASLTGSFAREPDFFELLQATILRGSLGLISGDPTQYSANTDNSTGGEFYRAATYNNYALDDGGAVFRPMTKASSYPVNAQPMDQIIQIGANIIDQYKSDNFPTEIILYGDHFYGIQNLPYISSIGDAALRVAAASPATNTAMTYDITSGTDSTLSGNNAYQAYVRWLDFALWNPHQNAKYPPSSGPSTIRVSVVNGKEYPFIVGLGAASPSGGTDYSGRIFELPGTSINTPSAGSPSFADGPAWIALPLSAYTNFPEPAVINYTNSYTSDGTPNINDPDGRVATSPSGNAAAGWQRAGVYLGWSKSPDNPYKTPASAPLYPGWQTNYNTGPNAPPAIGPVRYASVQTTLPVSVYLQYKDSAGAWHTYQEIDNLYYSRNTGAGDAFMETNDISWTQWYNTDFPTNVSVVGTSTTTLFDTSSDLAQYVNLPSKPSSVPTTWNGAFYTNADTALVNSFDPRTDRMNMWELQNNGAPPQSPTASQPISTVDQVVEPGKGSPTGPHFLNPTNSADAVWGSVAKTWVDNISISPMLNYDYKNGGADPTSFYRDRDSVARVGDAGGWTNVVMPSDAPTSPTNASPLTRGAIMQRPLHLNRPFRSVAELGYAFRDDPWKTLNFNSARSADAAMLDVFTIGSTNSATPTAPPPDFIAGKMNINSAAQNVLSSGTGTLNSPVMQALISQTLRDYDSPSGNTTTIATGITSASDIKNLSTNVVNFYKNNGPLYNISDLPGVFPQVTSNPVPVPLYTGLKNPSEALIRSLADSTGTRTWNLMIDIVAQAGKFSKQAGSLNNFTVEGEKHYWLHVAIDRFTGEIVDEQLEPVWE